MKKIFRILIIGFFLFFGIIIKANAEYAYCYYGISPDDKDLLFKEGFWPFSSDIKASVVLTIAYDTEKENFKTPVFLGRYINVNDANFSDGYSTEWSKDIDSKPISCVSGSGPTCFSALPSVNIVSLRDSNGKLVCPDIYLFKDLHINRANGNKSYTWDISLNKNQKTQSGDNYDKTYVLTYDAKYSKISNDNSNSNPTKEVATSCKYPYKYGFGSGEIQFSILKDGTVDQISASGTLVRDQFVYDGSPIGDLQCPYFLKFKSNAFTGVTTISIGTKDDYDIQYGGHISNADENGISLEYFSIKNTEKKIYVTADNNSLKATLNGQDITITNVALAANSPAPKYILYKNNQYTFTDSIDKSGDDFFVNYGGYSGLKLLTLNEITFTCEKLFGTGEGSFMGFLKNNVFKIIYIAVPIILLVLTTIDFAKTVFNDDKEGVSKAWKRFGKRAIAAILIFLTPTILIFIADIIGADDVNSCIKTIQNMNEGS